MPSSRRHALRKYEQNFHALCWPLPALLVGGAVFLGYLSDAGSWCAVDEVTHSREYLLCFYLPLLIAFTFNLVTYTAVLSHSRERRVSRITSLYLLGFAIVWLPSLLCRLQARALAPRAAKPRPQCAPAMRARSSSPPLLPVPPPLTHVFRAAMPRWCCRPRMAPRTGLRRSRLS